MCLCVLSSSEKWQSVFWPSDAQHKQRKSVWASVTCLLKALSRNRKIHSISNHQSAASLKNLAIFSSYSTLQNVIIVLSWLLYNMFLMDSCEQTFVFLSYLTSFSSQDLMNLYWLTNMFVFLIGLIPEDILCLVSNRMKEI